MKKTNAGNLTQGSISKSLMSFAVPVLLALFLQAMYGAVDLVIVGQFAGTCEQSAVASGSQLFHMITMMVVGLTMGLTVLIGTAVGSHDSERVCRGIGTGILLFTATAVLISAAVIPGSDVLCRWMKAPAEAFSQTSDYVRICGWGTVFIVAYNVLGAVFRGLGDSRTPLVTVAIACVINIAGDLLLVGVLGMGAAGAAIATDAAQAISVFISLFLIAKRGLPFSFSGRLLRFDRASFAGILLIGVPIALQDVLVQFSFLFIQVIVNGMGVAQSAAVGVAEKVCGFLMLVASAYLQSIAAFVAQNNGAGLFERSRKALFYGMQTAFMAGLCTGAAAFFGGSFLAAFFSKDAAVIALAHDYMKAYAIDCLLTAFLFCFIGYFNGCGRTVFVMIQGILGAFLVRVPVVYLISRISGATLFQIGLATPVSSAVQICLCLLAYRFYKESSRQAPAVSENHC